MRFISNRLSILITVLIFVIFAGYFIANISQFRPLLDVNPWLLLLIALIDILVLMANGIFIKFILKPFNKHISALESFYVSLLSSVGNFFAPAGAGFGFRAVYLKKKFGLAYSDFVSTLSGNYILVFLVSSSAGLLSLLLLRDRSDSRYSVLFLVFAIIFLVSVFLSLFKIPIKDVENIRHRNFRRLARIFYRVTTGWNHIISHRKLMLQLLGLTVFNLALTMVMIWLIIKALHLDIGFAPLLLFSVLGTLSIFLNLTPANLGVKEAIYLLSSSILGFSTAQILSIALIDRGVLFTVLLLSWLFSGRLRSRLATD